jgi:hypothetical protein
MQLHHLPRAERLLKDYVDVQIQQLIAQSHAVSSKYLSTREELIAKSRNTVRLRKQLENMLANMNSALNVPYASREFFSEVKGMGEEEIRRKAAELTDLLKLFPEEENGESEGEISR